MYQIHTHIAYFHDKALDFAIKNLQPEKDFSYSYQIYETMDSHLLSESDILFVKLDNFSIDEFKKYHKENIILILCVTYEQLISLDSFYYEFITDIWVLPLNSDFATYRFQQILHNLKLQKDKQLHEQYLDTLIDSMPDMVWFKRNDGIHLKVNQTFCQTVGKTHEDVVGKDHCYIWDVPREEFEKGQFVCNETEDLVRKLRKTCRFDEMVKSKGELRQFHTYKSPIFDDDNHVIGTVGIGHDITDLRNMSTELEIILRSMPFAILVKNDKNEIININNKFEEYFNLLEKELVGTEYDSWKNEYLKNIKNLGDHFQCQNKIRDHMQILEYREEPIFDIFHTNVGQLCIFRDVTIETNLEKQILQNSNTDFLTGMYNRRYLYEFMNNQENNPEIAVLYVDLDKFKNINDTYGHQIGDIALLEAARILNKCFENEFIARIGGDEFLVVLLNETQIDEIKKKVIQCLKIFDDTVVPSIQKKLLSASIGITKNKDSHVNLDKLIREADAALYKAKQAKELHYCLYEENYNIKTNQQ